MELIKQAKIERDVAIEEKKNEEVADSKKGKGMNKGSNTSSANGDKPKRERPKF